MLKDRWRILLKMIDVHLKNVPVVVITCLVLHNIYIILVIFQVIIFYTYYFKNYFKNLDIG